MESLQRKYSFMAIRTFCSNCTEKKVLFDYRFYKAKKKEKKRIKYNIIT